MTFDFGKDTLDAQDGWFKLRDIATMIGFRNPQDAINRYVSTENLHHVGLDGDMTLCGYGNEEAVWELIYAPVVRPDTKRKIGAWFRDVVLEALDKKAEIIPFESEQFGVIRCVEMDGEPWFVGKDVAEALGYERGSKAVVDHVDEDDREMINGKSQSCFGIELGQRGGWIINESGMYSLILSSKLPSAKKFKHWVTSEVLPSIRKTGSYDVKKQAKAIQMIMQRFDRLEAKMIEDKPKVAFYDDMMASDGSVRLDVLANVLAKNGVTRENGKPIGRDSLFKALRDQGFLTSGKVKDGYGNMRYENRPTQRAIERGLFERTASHNHGVLSYTVHVTPKGIAYFNGYFKN